MTSLILFGGTFDPPHLGHLHCALSVQQQLNADQFWFIPCKIPVLKPLAHASEHDRVFMLEALLADYPQFSIDQRELQRAAPSYSVETLRSIRKEWGGDVSINFLMGWDSFLQLTDWYQWEQLVSLANLVVMQRPGQPTKLSQTIHTLLKRHQIDDISQLLMTPKGGIYTLDAGQYPVSSSWIRQQIRLGEIEAIKSWLSPSVCEYIKVHSLYSC